MKRFSLKYLVGPALLLLLPLAMYPERINQGAEPFQISVVDQRTGQPMPGVRFVADNGITCYTRLDGTVAWHEASLMNRNVNFKVVAPVGYSVSGGGTTMRVTPGAIAKLRLSR